MQDRQHTQVSTLRNTTDPLVHVEDIAVSYGDRVALDGVSLDLHAGEVLALFERLAAARSTEPREV